MPTNSSTGFKSSVKTSGDFQFKDQTVGLSSDYSYNVTFVNSTNPATNLIIYDIIENSLTGANYDWHGTLKNVDISPLQNVATNGNDKDFLAPVLYYCTKAGAMTEGDLDITKDTIWTTTKPSDLSTVKAIAIDCRKTVSGADFALPADSDKGSMVYNINMQSPSTHEENNVYTYNEAHVSGNLGGERFDNKTVTKVMLHFLNPIFSKKSFPESGTSPTDRAGVVNKSTIDYKLSFKNPDDLVPIKNIVVEDVLDKSLVINNIPKVQIGEQDSIDINKSGKIVSYAISEITVKENNEDVKHTKFTATINLLEPGETVTIIVPGTVFAELNTEIDNTATITSVNGNTTNIQSETTYHYVTVTKAKIKKVNSKDEGLAGAKLQIYENNATNFDSSTGKIKSGATPSVVTIDEEHKNVTEFESTDKVMIFNLAPGDYVLHESSVPNLKIPEKNIDLYKLANDIPFTIDIEGITHVNGEAVNYVKMVDQPAYKIIFHENKPGNGNIDEKNKEFRVFEPNDLDQGKILHFYDIPDWAGDEYVFAGWYHSSNWKMYTGSNGASNIDSYVTIASNFESDTFSDKNSVSGTDGNYHLYAKWIKVDTVDKDETDDNVVDGYRGFGLAGVQIRQVHMTDSNYYDNETPGGMRFITSLSENLLSSIDALSTKKVSTPEGDVNVEYGYAVATEENIAHFVDGVGNKWDTPITGNYKNVDLTKYKLQYNDVNVNGVNTTGFVNGERFKKNEQGEYLLDENNNRILLDGINAYNDFAYVTNVNCTRGIAVKDKNGKQTGIIKDDHRNYTNYRLYTLVVTYDGDNDPNMQKKVDARAFIRYTDANGKVRVFYNDYKKNAYYGGCLCSFKQVNSMALQKTPQKPTSSE